MSAHEQYCVSRKWPWKESLYFPNENLYIFINTCEDREGLRCVEGWEDLRFLANRRRRWGRSTCDEGCIWLCCRYHQLIWSSSQICSWSRRGRRLLHRSPLPACTPLGLTAARMKAIRWFGGGLRHGLTYYYYGRSKSKSIYVDNS